MKIFKRFMNSLKKEPISMEIVNPRDTLNIKDIETEEEQNLLTKYTEEYLSKLKGNVLSSIDLEIDELNKQMEMYTSLITEIILGLHKDAFLTEGEKLEAQKDKTNLIIKARKLIMYLNNISSIKRDAEIKLMALERINKEHRILNIFKRKALQSKITNLFLSVYSLNFSGRGLILNSLSCLNEYKSLTEEDKKYLESKGELTSRKELLLEMVKRVLPLEIIKSNGETFESIYEEIAYLEYLLEIEVYKHMDVLPVLIDKIRNIDISKEGSLEEIEDLELRLRIFYEFGKNLVIEEMFQELYEKKFLILTRDIMDYNKYKNSFRTINGMLCQKCYERIIARKIETIFSEYNTSLKELFKNNRRNGLKLISKIFKTKSDRDMFYDILKDTNKLAFLLFLEKRESLESFFKNYWVDKDSYTIFFDFEEHIFTWASVIPYETACRILISIGLINYSPFCRLYNLTKKSSDKDDNVYYLPEGIKQIHIKDTDSRIASGMSSDKSMILRAIRQNAKNKEVHTPSTMRSIKGDLFSGIKIKSLYLNEGFESLTVFPIQEYSIETIGIPSTLSVMENIGIVQTKLKHITINCTKDLENFRNALRNTLKHFITFKGCFNDDSNPLNSPQYYDLSDNKIFLPYLSEQNYLIDISFETLILKNYKNSGFDIVIDTSTLKDKFCVKRREAYGITIKDRELNNLISYIFELVEKEYERLSNEVYDFARKLI